MPWLKAPSDVASRSIIIIVVAHLIQGLFHHRVVCLSVALLFLSSTHKDAYDYDDYDYDYDYGNDIDSTPRGDDMALIKGGFLRLFQTFLYLLAFLCAAIVLGIYSYFLATIADRNGNIMTWVKAVEGISGAAVLYTIFATLLTCCLGGISFLAFTAIVRASPGRKYHHAYLSLPLASLTIQSRSWTLPLSADSSPWLCS
jgi:hypothetical protein